MSNEAIKMSDVFELPLRYEGALMKNSKHGAYPMSGLTFFQIKAIVHAVNNHDTLTAKLEEAVELLNKTTGQLHKLKDFIVSPLEIDMVCKTVKRNDDFLQAIKQIKE